MVSELGQQNTNEALVVDTIDTQWISVLERLREDFD